MSVDHEAAIKQVLAYVVHKPEVIHSLFFAHRHPQASADFHHLMLRDWYSSKPEHQHMCFRGAAKSTLGEEALTILACTGQIKNGIIIGSNEPRAKERLGAIKHELETNQRLIDTFGNQQGPTWQESKIVLQNGTCLQAFGWNQSLRGIKHLHWRPDYGWMDDVEDEENTRTPAARALVISRLLRVVIPAIDAPGRRIRSTATPQDPEALAVKLHTLWQGRKFPVKYRDPLTGEWMASWPERKSLPEINKIEEGYRELGDLQGFQREYMCEATASEDQRFNSDHMRAEPIARTYQATYAVYDPARTVNELSAHTGKVVFSWAGHRLIVWESSGNFWKPDEIVHDIFQTDEKYNPIYIGVEQDGLHEFIMQPIRAQAMQRGRPVPIKALKAPKGKLNFIQGLQPFFQAHEVVFAPDLSFHSEAIKQFLSFPTGRIDVPNALAYALTMRVGLPMFDNFGDVHVAANLRPDFRSPYYLAANSNGQHVTAVLAQYVRGQFHILNDWILDGDAGTVLADIVTAAKLEAMKPVKLIIPQEHFGTHDAIGMKPAALKLGLRAFKCGKAQAGLEEVRRLLSTSVHGQPSLSISPAASWTLRAFAGGYARAVTKEGGLAAEPLPGPYATLMVGLQSLVGFSMVEGEDSNVRFAKTNDGTSYITAKR